MSRYSTKPVFHDGRWMSVYEASKLTGISQSTISYRLKHGHPFEQPGHAGLEAKRYRFRGRMMSVPEVAAMIGVHPTTVYDHIEGGRIRDCFTDPRTPQYVTHAGLTMTLSAWSRRTGIPRPTIRWRLDQGWPLDKVFRRNE